MLRPPMGCSTFIVFDFIRVPPPAARTITVRSLSTGSATGSPVSTGGRSGLTVEPAGKARLRTGRVAGEARYAPSRSAAATWPRIQVATEAVTAPTRPMPTSISATATNRPSVVTG